MCKPYITQTEAAPCDDPAMGNAGDPMDSATIEHTTTPVAAIAAANLRRNTSSN